MYSLTQEFFSNYY